MATYDPRPDIDLDKKRQERILRNAKTRDEAIAAWQRLNSSADIVHESVRQLSLAMQAHERVLRNYIEQRLVKLDSDDILDDDEIDAVSEEWWRRFQDVQSTIDVLKSRTDLANFTNVESAIRRRKGD